MSHMPHKRSENFGYTYNIHPTLSPNKNFRASVIEAAFSGCGGSGQLWDCEAGVQRGGRHQLRHEDSLQEETAEEGRHFWKSCPQEKRKWRL